MTRILITGASGCVGQYISRWLLDNSDAELLLWLRDPAKLTAFLQTILGSGCWWVTCGTRSVRGGTGNGEPGDPHRHGMG